MLKGSVRPRRLDLQILRPKEIQMGLQMPMQMDLPK